VGDILAFTEPPPAGTASASPAAAASRSEGVTLSGERAGAVTELPPAGHEASAGIAVCVASPTILCLNEQRFAVAVKFTDEGKVGDGIGSNVTADTGKFYFFSEENIELVLKVLDGRAINGKFWVFFGSLSDVEFEVEVTDVMTGKKKIYKNPSGTFASVSDISAFEDEATPPALQ
jgi:hypothetical protein